MNLYYIKGITGCFGWAFILVNLFIFVTLTLDQVKGQNQGGGQDEKLSDAFLVKLKDCTGSLISDDWVISAAHCFESMFNWGALGVRASENNHGDTEMDFTEVNNDNNGRFISVDKPVALSGGKEDEVWTKETESSEPSIYPTPTASTSTVSRKFWRKVDKIIMHQSFKSEALSWKGYDFVLIKLSKQRGDGRAKGKIVPVCLPGKGFPEFVNKNVFMAGFGRRQIPHCLTDMQGPEKFELCGRKKWCAQDHRRKDCQLDFLDFGNQTQEACISNEESPSAKDDRCRSLHSYNPSVQNSTVHLFDEAHSYIATCYPAFDGLNETPKGWCTIRPAGVRKNTPPETNKGWGFCSTDPSQENCNGRIETKTDTSPHVTSFLTEKYCIDKLADNLRAEQPQARPEEYNKLLDQCNIFCTGQNQSNTLNGDKFYKMTTSQGLSQEEGEKYIFKDLKQVMSTSELAEKVFKASKEIKRFYVNGGPSCFGDSGGPLWRTVTIPSTPVGSNDNAIIRDKKVPVLVGVFSFMLWGTCYGAQEPGYNGRVTSIIQWIHKYIESNQTCIVSVEKHIDENKHETRIMQLHGDMSSRVVDKAYSNSQGFSDSQLVGILVTGWIIPLTTVAFVWKHNIFNLFNL